MHHIIRYTNQYGVQVSTFSDYSCISITQKVKILFSGTKKECEEEEVNYIPQSSSLTKTKMFDGLLRAI